MTWWTVGSMLVLVSGISALLPVHVGAQTMEPALPTTFVDTTIVVPTGRTISVQAGQDLQAALNAARPGDVVSIQAGATFTGNFTLPKKEESGWITVRTSAPDASLAAPGTRVTPAQAALMPKLVSENSAPTLQAAPGAQGYRLIGLDLSVSPRVDTISSIVAFGGQQASPADTPRNLILDRSYVHGQPQTNTFRGVLLNSANSAVIDSYVSQIHVAGFDSQAILGYNGPGPFKIVNNHLEASGENIMFGGADPAIRNLVPSDIEIRKNHLFKPLSWSPNDPSFAGQAWTVKNLLELKNAQRVLIDGNVLENSLGMTAVVLTPRNQEGAAPWSAVRDVVFRNNVVKNAASGFVIQSTDDLNPSESVKRVAVVNNLWLGVNRTLFGLTGARPLEDLTIARNTALPVGHSTYYAEMGATPGLIRFRLTDNVFGFGAYGVAFAQANGELAKIAPGAVIAGNALITGLDIGDGRGGERNTPAWVNQAMYLSFASLAAAGVNPDGTLTPDSPLRRILLDGGAIGVDFVALILEAETGLASGTDPSVMAILLPAGDPLLDALVTDLSLIQAGAGCGGGATGDEGCLSATPEPTSLILFGTGLAGLGAAAVRRRRKARATTEAAPASETASTG